MTTALAVYLARYIRAIPALVVQILFGIVVAGVVFSLPLNNPAISFLSQLGLFAIFFRVGLDFDLTAPELTSTTPARSASAGVIGSFAAVLLASVLLGNPLRDSIYVGLATVSTSVSVAIYSFLALGPLSHLEAKVAVLAGLFDDLLGLTTIAVLTALFSHSLGGLASLVVSLAVVVLSYLAQRRLADKSFDLSKLRRYGLMSLLLIVVIFFWYRFGLTLAIAGFVSGAFSGPILKKSDRVYIDRATVVLSPFFLVSLGLLVNFDQGITGTEVLAILVLSVALIVGKIPAALVVKNQVADATLYWFSMVPRAEVAGIGLALVAPHISASLALEAVLAVVATSLITPFVIARKAKSS